MKHEINHGPVFTTVKVLLNSGEAVKAESGAMVTMSPTVDLKVKKTTKGFFGAIKGMMGGESLLATVFTATEDNSEVVLSPAGMGDILHFNLQGQTLYAQPGAWLAGHPDLEISTKGSLKGMISGEGLFLQKISGNGDVFLNTFGAVIELDLADGQEYVVDTGAMIAYEESVTYKITKAAKGLIASFFSGEGLVCRFQGPGKVWVQTRTLSSFAQMIQAQMTKR